MHIVLQHAQRNYGGLRGKQGHGGRGSLSGKKPGLPPYSPIRQHGVQAAKLTHGHFRAAENKTQPVMLLAEGKLHPGSFQKGIQPRPEFRCQHDGGNVAA